MKVISQMPVKKRVVMLKVRLLLSQKQVFPGMNWPSKQQKMIARSAQATMLIQEDTAKVDKMSEEDEMSKEQMKKKRRQR